MKGKTLTKKQNISAIIITLPFLLAIFFLIIGLFTLDDIFLEKGFSLNFKAIVTLSLIHFSFILILKKLGKIEIDLPKILWKKIVAFIGYSLLLFLSNFLLEMGLRMNFNYWLKKDRVEKIELIVIDKNVSHGKATDYYIIFNSNKGKLKNKVRRRKYEVYSIGEIYQAEVNEGYFDGYFLTEPMKLIKK